MRIDHLVVVLGGLTATVVGAWVSWQEVNQFLTASLDGPAHLAGLVEGGLIPGLSSEARMTYAKVCLVALPRLEARFLPPDQAKRLHAACSGELAALTHTGPVNAYLWLARAQLARDSGDWPEFNHSLVLAQASGPNEYWLAAQRFGLALRSLDHMKPEALESVDLDIAMLAQTPQGSRLLAAEYLASEAFRTRVAAVVDTLSVPVQGEFLSNVQMAAGLRKGRP